MSWGQGFRNFIWVISAITGPAIAYLLTRSLGSISWICRNLRLCKFRLFVFFALSFVCVWGVYWACYWIVRRFESQIHSDKPKPGGKIFTLPEDFGPSDNLRP